MNVIAQVVFRWWIVHENTLRTLGHWVEAFAVFGLSVGFECKVAADKDVIDGTNNQSEDNKPDSRAQVFEVFHGQVRIEDLMSFNEIFSTWVGPRLKGAGVTAQEIEDGQSDEQKASNSLG